MRDRIITFVPTVGNAEPYTGFIDEGIVMLKDLGYQPHLLDASEFKGPVLAQELERVTCICISGGGALYLLQELKEKHLIGPPACRIQEGMFYIGESTGAIVTTPGIGHSQVIDDKTLMPALVDYTTPNISDHSVFPHIGEHLSEMSSRETSGCYRNPSKLIPLNSHEAVLVNNQGYTILCETDPERKAL